jgi:O-antigen/teichoic acid export membrane protein
MRNVVLLPFLTKGLGVEAYGAWVQVLAIVELGTHVATLSLSAALTRFCGAVVPPRAAAAGLWTSILFCLAAGGAVASFGYGFAETLSINLLHTPAFTPLFRIAAILVPVSACERLLLSFFQARLQIFRHSASHIFETVAYVALSIVLIKLGFEASDLLLGLLAIRVAVLLAGIAMAHRNVRLAPPNLTVLRGYLRFSLPLVMVSILIWITGLSDRYVIGYFHGAAAVGGYAVAYTLGMVCTLLFAPAFTILTPTLVALWEQRDLNSLNGHLWHTVRYAVAISIPAVVGLTVLASPVVDVVSSSDYFVGSLTVGLVAAGLLLWMLAAMSETLLNIMQLTRVIALNYGLATGVNLGLNFALVPRFGVFGAAMATFAAYLVLLLSMSRSSRRQGLSVPVDWPLVAKCCLAASTMAAVLLTLDVRGPLLLGGAIGLAVFAYAGVLLLLRAFDRSEWHFWKSIFASSADRQDG